LLEGAYVKRVLEEILEAMWKADEQGDSSLEAIRRICSREVTEEDLDVLEKRQRITREPGRAVLTHEGRKEARSVVRRHRLAEILFATVLDLDVEKREEIACEVEHTLLPETEEAICTLLGHPSICPEGKLIPPGRCCSSRRTMASAVVANLNDLNMGDRGRITYIKPRDHVRLHRLTAFGLTAGTVVEVHQCSPAVCIRYEGTELSLDREVAGDIYVARLE
jgi:DtxR family Mn-dependent transcriptional regulator